MAPGCAPGAGATVYVPDPPPKRPNEIVPDRPGPRHVWAPGHWDYRPRAKRYKWVAGHWARLRHAHHTRWIPGHWRKTPQGYKWVPGRFR